MINNISIMLYKGPERSFGVTWIRISDSRSLRSSKRPRNPFEETGFYELLASLREETIFLQA